jgi:hypothetical protein
MIENIEGFHAEEQMQVRLAPKLGHCVIAP